jgi:hypothetical protein
MVLPQAALGGHHWNRFTNQRSPVRDGGFADYEAAVNLALQGGRAVIIEAGHQHGPGLIRKIVRGLTQGGKKGLKRGEPFRIVERGKLTPSSAPEFTSAKWLKRRGRRRGL